jgi:hypothetical protein
MTPLVKKVAGGFLPRKTARRQLQPSTRQEKVGAQKTCPVVVVDVGIIYHGFPSRQGIYTFNYATPEKRMPTKLLTIQLRQELVAELESVRKQWSKRDKRAWTFSDVLRKTLADSVGDSLNPVPWEVPRRGRQPRVRVAV